MTMKMTNTSQVSPSRHQNGHKRECEVHSLELKYKTVHDKVIFPQGFMNGIWKYIPYTPRENKTLCQTCYQLLLKLKWQHCERNDHNNKKEKRANFTGGITKRLLAATFIGTAGEGTSWSLPMLMHCVAKTDL